MQSVDLILYSVSIGIITPVLLFILTAYTVYNSISMVKYSRRRTDNIFKAVILGGRELHPPKEANGKDANGNAHKS